MGLGHLLADSSLQIVAGGLGPLQPQSRFLDVRLQATAHQKRELNAESPEQQPAQSQFREADPAAAEHGPDPRVSFPLGPAHPLFPGPDPCSHGS